MMRKDVRIGFAIGGVLLAVLIVYGLVTSGPNPRNNEVTLAPDDPGAVSNPNKNNNGTAPRPGPTPANGAGAPQTGEPSGESDPATSGTASRPANGTGANGTSANGTGANDTLAANPSPTTAPADKWEHALKTGALPMMAKTETPSPNGAGAAPAPTDGGTTSPPAQPANGSTEGSAGATNANGGAVNPTNGTTTPPANAPPSNGSTTGTFNAADLANMASVPPSNTTGSTGSTGASTVAPAPAPGQRTHVVQPNETFASIAEVAYGSQHYYPHIARANPNINPKKMRAGMTIVLPDRDQVVAKDTKAAESTTLSGTGAGTTDAASVGSSTASGAQQAAAVLPPIDERTQYRVQPAESLYKISLKLYGRADKVNAIYELNKDQIGPNRDRLRSGLILKLPEPPTQTAAAR